MSDVGAKRTSRRPKSACAFGDGAPVTSQRLRRVALQFIALCLVIATLCCSVRIEPPLRSGRRCLALQCPLMTVRKSRPDLLHEGFELVD